MVLIGVASGGGRSVLAGTRRCGDDVDGFPLRIWRAKNRKTYISRQTVRALSTIPVVSLPAVRRVPCWRGTKPP